VLGVSGFRVIGAPTPRAALELIEDASIGLVISDVVMPGLTGFQLLEEVRARRPSLPVLLVTGAGTEDTLSEALARGASGLIAKPFSHAELRGTVEAVLARAEASERDVYQRLLAPTLTSALANAIEARDAGTGGHTERLAVLAVRIGYALGLRKADLETIRLGAILHDIGKIGIPDRVLLKPGPLDREERELMKSHTVIGDRLLEPLDALAAARPIVRHHHERWDGGPNGYPDGLAGCAIPVGARIVAVADAVEAMSAKRPYREPLDGGAVLAELALGRGEQWDPSLVDLVVELVDAGELAVGSGGVHLRELEDPRRAGDDDLEAEALPALVTRLLDLNTTLERNVVSPEDVRTWLEYSRLGETDKRVEALRALDALNRSVRGARAA
jgi:putative two-component system response regulator